MEPPESYEAFLKLHRLQLESSGVPSIYWPTIYRKITNEVFDAGETFKIMLTEYEDDSNALPALFTVIVCKEGGIKFSDPSQIYLIDHAWTYQAAYAREHLANTPGLAERMSSLMNIPVGENDDAIDLVLRDMWKFSQTYNFGNPDMEAEQRVPVWYVMDEFGSKIQHSDNPSCRVIPFFFVPEMIAFSLLFPIKDLEEGDNVTRDYVEGPYKDDVKDALMQPWKPMDLTHISYAQSEPSEEYFTAMRTNETIPKEEEVLNIKPQLPIDRRIKVYAEYTVIREHLKHPRFEIVDTLEEADIWWLHTHFKTFKEFSEESPNKMINQFPFEHVITIKDLLCIVCRRQGTQSQSDDLSSQPRWLPTTYNLKTELVEFVSYFQRRQKRDLDNHWIIKPWNLARGLDTHVTANLDQILRLPFSGPKIAQKYLHDPVLFNRPEVGRVKFDVRYIVLLRQTQPLEVYAYQRFWLRFANKEFELRDLEDYERHFTVMNYNEANLLQMFCDDFIKQFEEQYPDVQWKDVEQDIFKMFRELFEAAASVAPPKGIPPSPQSRAMYAIDLMLDWNYEGGKKVMVPQLLEVNWAPDCDRACMYYPEFFNDVFSLLFLGTTEGTHCHKL